MINISPIKIMVILTVIVVLLGPDKLPEVAHKLGSYWRSLKGFQQRVETELREAIPDLPSSHDIVRIVRNPVQLLDEFASRKPASDQPERWSPDYVDPYEVRDEGDAVASAHREPTLASAPVLAPLHAPFDPSLN